MLKGVPAIPQVINLLVVIIAVLLEAKGDGGSQLDFGSNPQVVIAQSISLKSLQAFCDLSHLK